MADDDTMYHNEFVDVTIHTAKCDICNKHNKSVMKQCTKCGMNFCTPCWLKCGEDGTHILNSGDTGYAGAVANKAQREQFLKPQNGSIKKEASKSPSPANSPRRTRRTRRRRVIIEESEDEEIDDIQAHTEDHRGLDISGQRLSDRRRSKLPELRVNERTSPSTEGPSNQPTSAGSQFPESEDIPNFDTDKRNSGADTVDFNDTMAGVDSLLALASSAPTSRRSSANSGPEVSLRLRGGASSMAALSEQQNDDHQTYDQPFFAPDSEHVIEQHAHQRAPSIVVSQDTTSVQDDNIFTPNEPLPADLLSSLFPNDVDFNQALWSSTAAGFGEGLGSNEEDLWDNFFYNNGTANGGNCRKVSDGTSATLDDGDNEEKERGWIVPPEDEDIEEGEIKEDEADSTSKARQ